MMADQPGDQPGVVAAHAVLEHEGFGIQCAEFGMIAAAPLGDVVKQSGQVGEFGCRQRPHDFRAARIFVIVSGQRKAPQVADHEQRVFIDRVGMKEVVLHAADDAAKGGDVAAEYAIAVHAPQFVRDAFLGAQDLQEQAMVARILPEPVVDQVQAAPYQRNGSGAHALQFRVLLQDQEEFQQCRRRAVENIIGGDLQEAVADLEALVDRLRRRVSGLLRMASWNCCRSISLSRLRSITVR